MNKIFTSLTSDIQIAIASHNTLAALDHMFKACDYELRGCSCEILASLAWDRYAKKYVIRFPNIELTEYIPTLGTAITRWLELIDH